MTRAVTDILYRTDGTAWASAPVTFERTAGSFDDGSSWPPDEKQVTTDATGAYSVQLWPDAAGSLRSRYHVTYPNGDVFYVSIPDGSTPITMPEIRVAAVAPPVPPSALDAHVAAPDPHAGYLLPAEADLRYAALVHSQAWSTITGTPTTLGGYGITDAYTKTAADARYAPIAHNQAWSTITGTPTTLGGYGITDAYTKTAADARYAPIAHNQAWSTITGTPSTLGGYGITDAVPRTQSQVANLTPLRVMTVQPADATKGPFVWEIGGSLFNSTFDTVQYFGYNAKSGGTAILAGEALLSVNIESDFEFPAGTHLFEYYVDFYSNNGSIHNRPFFTQINKATGLASVIVDAGTVTNSYIALQANAVQMLKLSASQMLAAVPFVWSQSGAKVFIRNVNNAGTNTLTLLQTSATDVVRYGDANSFGHTGHRFETKVNKFFDITAGTTLNNIGINGGSYGGGDGVVFMLNAATVPATNPTGGGVLYVEAGALKYRGSSGTVTQLGAA